MHHDGQVVEPVAQRIQPSNSPMANTCNIPSQSYWMCMQRPDQRNQRRWQEVRDPVRTSPR